MYAEEKILRFKMICNSVYSKTEVFIKKKKKMKIEKIDTIK